MTTKNLKKLDLTIIKEKESIVVSSRDALKNVTTIDWSKDVLSGEKKLSYPGNFEILHNNQDLINSGNKRDGFIKLTSWL